MIRSETEPLIAKIKALWPKWAPSGDEEAIWTQRMMRLTSADTADSAIDQHYVDHSARLRPALAGVIAAYSSLAGGRGEHSKYPGHADGISPAGCASSRFCVIRVKSDNPRQVGTVRFWHYKDAAPDEERDKAIAFNQMSLYANMYGGEWAVYGPGTREQFEREALRLKIEATRHLPRRGPRNDRMAKWGKAIKAAAETVAGASK